MATIKLKRGLESNVSSLPKEDGSLIFGYNTAAVPATMQLDQNIGGTVQRLNLSVANSGTSDYSKNSSALEGSSLSQILDSSQQKNAFIELDNTTNDIVKLTRASGSTVQKIIDNVAHSSTSSYSVNAGSLQGHILSTLSSGTSADFSNKIPYIDSNGVTEISRYIDFHGDSTSRDFSIRLDTGVASNLIITGPSASTVTANYFNGVAKDSNALSGSSLQQILDSFNFDNVAADSATRLISSTKSIANNFTIRTGIPTSGWTQYPIYPIYNTNEPDLIDYKGKNLSILHMDGGAQRHDIVALNGVNDGLIYATATSAGTTASRIERILDGGNYGSLITNLNKKVTFADGLKAQKNVDMDGGNFVTGDSSSGEDWPDGSNVAIKIFVSGNKLVIKTK